MREAFEFLSDEQFNTNSSNEPTAHRATDDELLDAYSRAVKE